MQLLIDITEEMYQSVKNEMWFGGELWYKALKNGKPIKTGQEICDDLISRQALLDSFGFSEKTRKYGGDHSGYNTLMFYEIQDIIEDLPPITSIKTDQKLFTPEEVWNILVEEGQHDPRFKLGEIIEYSPTDVLAILKKTEKG